MGTRKERKVKSLKRALQVPLEFHWSALILLFLFLIQAGIMGIALFLVVMFSLLIHEYCHVWAAISEKMHVEKVVVFALGAGALIDSERILFDRRAGLKVALAGPGGSLALAIIGSIFWILLPSTFTAYLFIINVAFCIFNLLPLFPSDGGRVLYSLLSFKATPEKAMNIAVITSYVLSGIGALVSLWFSMWWMLVLFIFLIVFARSQHKGFEKVLYERGYK